MEMQDSEYARVELEIARTLRHLRATYMRGSVVVPGLSANELHLVMHTGMYIKRFDHSPQAREIGTTMRLSPSVVSQLLRSCEKKGYIKRVRSDHDARVTLVELRDSGWDAYREGFTKFHEQIHRLARVVGINDLRELLRILKKLERLAESQSDDVQNDDVRNDDGRNADDRSGNDMSEDSLLDDMHGNPCSLFSDNDVQRKDD